jgi:putative ABC transport system substrate-binding protein
MSGDLLGSGLVASLNRPGGNVTGLTFFQPEVNAKRIELLREIIPQSSRVAVLFNPNNTLAPLAIQTMALTATSLKLELQQFEVRRSASAFSAMNARRADAVVVVDDSLIFNSYNLVADLAMAQRLPSIALPNFPEAGGLTGYGVDWAAESRKLALFVLKIIGGGRPTTCPLSRRPSLNSSSI